jgi:eukaryotic-like serine/threonine-protein kinase
MNESPPTGEWPPPSTVSLPRPTVPGYDILEELGRGGMGVVYKARQLILNRLVALKLIRDGALAAPEDLARFRIEAEAAARMRHPNIVQIFDVGEHEGRPYFAMELVDGGSLDRHLAGQALPAPAAAELVRTLALAVQHAHEQKVVHRDLKPANILLQMGNVEWGMGNERPTDTPSPIPHSRIPHCVKITDFGLAKRLDTDSTALTMDGAVLGTVSYMAPEQAEGRVRDIGPAVDVYALGAILYELLTGRPPFEAASWHNAVHQVVHDEPAPPTRLRADVPSDLETVCLKCLEKESARRYASAAALADDLGRFLAAEPVAAVPLSDRERLVRLAQRDGYEIAGEIGRGPRSTVYRALYGPLKQVVALKVFTADACTRQQWDNLLRRSADLWAALAHPHLVPVHQAGWWDGSPYVATEYVPQGSLAAKIASQNSAPPFLRTRVKPMEAVEFVERLTTVVGYLHRQGVVHGNLKPSNVLLAADAIPRLVDLRPTGGLFLGQLADDDDDPTGLGYLAPEVLREPGAEPHPNTDFYGLGLILYELLTGRPPFTGATAQEVREQVRSQDPIPLSRLNSEVTPQVEACCLRCLRKNPWQRYARAYDLSMRLRSLRDDPEDRGVRPQRRPKRPSPDVDDRGREP